MIKGRIFWFCPLSEYGMSCLGAWIRWASDKKCDGKLTNVDSIKHLQTAAGAIQITFWSTRKHHEDKLETIAELIGTDEELALEIFEFFVELNWPKKDSAIPALGKVSTLKPATEDEVYCTLCRHYHWTPEQVGSLTRVQQTTLFKNINDKINADGTMTFDNEEDYLRHFGNKPK